MKDMESFLIFAVAILFIGPVLGVIALVQISTLQAKISKLNRAFEGLSPENKWLTAIPEATVEGVGNTNLAGETAETTPSVPELSESVLQRDTQSAEEDAFVQDTAANTAEPLRNVEQALASRWLVWVGGVAIAVGGLLFVKYAHDNGLIPPVLRVVLGLAFAGALIFGGEWIRKKRGESVTDYVPAALSAAGLVIAFGVVYAAYALYNLLSPTLCFPALVAIGLGALWLSRRQGPLIAALGLVGSFVAPMLVPSEQPNAWGFFAYLAVIVAASLYELRNRPWWWLGYAAIGGATVWSVLWLNSAFDNSAAGPFALLLGVAAVFIPRDRAILDEDQGSLATPATLAPPMLIAFAGCAAGALILAVLVNETNHSTSSLLYFALGMLAITGFGWMRQGLVVAPLLAAALSFVVLMLWKDVGFHEWAMDERGFWSTVPGLIQPPRFCNAMFLALFAFGAVGAYGVMRKAEPRPWAALVAGAAFLFLFGAWARADFTQPDTLWAVLGAGLSAALAGLAFLHRKSLDSLAENLTENLTEKLAWRDAVTVLLGGAALLALFALDRLLNGVWLTLAIAVLATSYAFATRTFPIGHIGFMASTMATLAAARLFVGREFWGEPTNVPLGAHWVVYGYGIPAVLFWQASRWLKGDDFARWRVALEGLSLGLLISLVSLELRVLIGGGITSDDMGLLELSAHALSWLGAAYGLAYRQQLYSSLVSLWGARVLLAAACAAFVLCLTLFNPVFSGDAVAGGQIINALWLAYLAPVALLAIMARKLEGLGLAKFRTALGVFALVLLISFITLWTKRQFQDATLVAEFESQAESYTTSLAWLISGIGIFIAGLKLERAPIRYGGLAILILAVLKVFGIDLFSLGGLWRIGSIVGLGACLIGVGWLYTRYIGMAATKKPELEI